MIKRNKAGSERNMGLLETTNHSNDYWDAELRIGIKGQKALQVRQCFTMERMFINWDSWLVKIAVWLIRKS